MALNGAVVLDPAHQLMFKHDAAPLFISSGVEPHMVENLLCLGITYECMLARINLY